MKILHTSFLPSQYHENLCKQREVKKLGRISLISFESLLVNFEKCSMDESQELNSSELSPYRFLNLSHSGPWNFVLDLTQGVWSFYPRCLLSVLSYLHFV